MDAEVGIVFKVTGLEEVKGAFAQLAGAAKESNQQIVQSTQQVATATQTSTAATKEQDRAFGTVASTVGGARQAFTALSGAIAGGAAIASIFAKNNQELKRNLEVVSLTLSAASTAVHAFGAALKLAALNPITLTIAAIGGLIAVGVYLTRNWEQVRAAALRIWGAVRDWFVHFLQGFATSMHGLNEIIAGVFTLDPAQIKAGWGELLSGLGQLKSSFVDLGKGVVSLAEAGWDKLKDLFGSTGKSAKAAAAQMREAVQDAMQAVQDAAATELAHAQTIDSASAKIAAQIGIIQREIASLRALEVRVKANKAEHAAFGQVIQQLQNDLVPLQDALFKTTEAYRVQQEVLEHLVGEHGNFAAAAREVRDALDAEAAAAHDAAVAQAMVEWKRDEIASARAIAHAFEDVGDSIERMGDVSDITFGAMADQVAGAATAAEELALKWELVLSKLNGQFGEFSGLALATIGNIGSAFAEFVGDILSGTKDFGTAFTDLIKAIVEGIIKVFAELAVIAGLLSLILRIPFAEAFRAVLNWRFPIPVPGHQTGGEFRVTQPTLMMVGERGPEQVRVFPSGTRESLPPAFATISQNASLPATGGTSEEFNPNRRDPTDRPEFLVPERSKYPYSEWLRRLAGYPVPYGEMPFRRPEPSGPGPTTITMNFSGMTTMDEIQAAKLGRRFEDILRRERARTFVRR